MSTLNRPKNTSSDKQNRVAGTVPNSFNPPLKSQGRPPLPMISNQNNTSLIDVIDIGSESLPSPDEADLVLPTKVFQAKRTSVKDLSQGLCSHLWFRRIKEIFLVMGTQNDAFTQFDMEIARHDMIQTCDQYLENERPKVSSSY